MKQLPIAVSVCVTAMALFAGCDSGRQATAPDDVPRGWTLVWEDDFDSTAVDTAVWSRVDRGRPDWNKYMSKLDTLYEVRDGNLVLRGIANYDGSGDSVPFLTGGVWSKDRKHFTRGRVEVRARLQGADGAWPAIWLMPQGSHSATGYDRPQWPMGGEIDIMERLNNDSVVWQTVHSNYTVNLGRTDNPPSTRTIPFDPDGYNDFAVELYADSVRFLVNDVVNYSYPRVAGLDSLVQFPFDDYPYYLILDMQLEGNWVNTPARPDQMPIEMLIDRVRFYQPAE